MLEFGYCFSNCKRFFGVSRFFFLFILILFSSKIMQLDDLLESWMPPTPPVSNASVSIVNSNENCGRANKGEIMIATFNFNLFLKNNHVF